MYFLANWYVHASCAVGTNLFKHFKNLFKIKKIPIKPNLASHHQITQYLASVLECKRAIDGCRPTNGTFAKQKCGWRFRFVSRVSCPCILLLLLSRCSSRLAAKCSSVVAVNQPVSSLSRRTSKIEFIPAEKML